MSDQYFRVVLLVALVVFVGVGVVWPTIKTGRILKNCKKDGKCGWLMGPHGEKYHCRCHGEPIIY